MPGEPGAGRGRGRLQPHEPVGHQPGHLQLPVGQEQPAGHGGLARRGVQKRRQRVLLPAGGHRLQLLLEHPHVLGDPLCEQRTVRVRAAVEQVEQTEDVDLRELLPQGLDVGVRPRMGAPPPPLGLLGDGRPRLALAGPPLHAGLGCGDQPSHGLRSRCRPLSRPRGAHQQVGQRVGGSVGDGRVQQLAYDPRGLGRELREPRTQQRAVRGDVRGQQLVQLGIAPGGGRGPPGQQAGRAHRIPLRRLQQRRTHPLLLRVGQQHAERLVRRQPGQEVRLRLRPLPLGRRGGAPPRLRDQLPGRRADPLGDGGHRGAPSVVGGGARPQQVPQLPCVVQRLEQHGAQGGVLPGDRLRVGTALRDPVRLARHQVRHQDPAPRTAAVRGQCRHRLAVHALLRLAQARAHVVGGGPTQPGLLQRRPLGPDGQLHGPLLPQAVLVVEREQLQRGEGGEDHPVPQVPGAGDRVVHQLPAIGEDGQDRGADRVRRPVQMTARGLRQVRVDAREAPAGVRAVPAPPRLRRRETPVPGIEVRRVEERVGDEAAPARTQFRPPGVGQREGVLVGSRHGIPGV
nr:hypothetical protein [Streptomyces sp. MH191]